MTSRQTGLSILKNAVGNAYADFRDGQWEAIDMIVNQKRKLLVVERTGWGKSSVYFTSTRILRNSGAGVTIIISPLLALMRNQIEAAARFNLLAETINSSNTEDWETVKANVLSGKTDILYISPERLANNDFVQTILLPISSSVGLFVVDEAHCISDWGHDFRTDYRRIVNILKQLPSNIPVLATTATANDRVIKDINSQLGAIAEQRGPLERKSLSLQTLRLPSQASRLAWLAANLPKIEGTGIIYTLTKRDAEQVSSWLKSNGIEAAAYYSGVLSDDFDDTDAYRAHLEDLLLENKIKALVATIALGMGYDKPDLAFVIHYQAPGSIVGYYQQVGRAGRGIDNAYGILLSGREDDDIHGFFRKSSFPPKERVDAILELLEENDGGLSVPRIFEKLNFRKVQIEQVLKYLNVENPAPVYKEKSKWLRAPVRFQMDNEKVQRLTRKRELEWQQVLDYIEFDGCKMAYLQTMLDDPNPKQCGRCQNCTGEPILNEVPTHEIEVRAALFLRHSEFPLQLKKQVAAGALPIYGWRGNLKDHLKGEEGRVMSRWRDAGWGAMVAKNKQEGRFQDDLVEAMVEMINKRWNPDPFPAWLTCVPSLRHPELVPDFTGRLAKALGISFIPCVKKQKETPPQKEMENSYFQSSNLDGAFVLEGEVSHGPVFLFDDAVDSGWTLTIISTLLLEAGSGPVYPIALTSTRLNH